PTARASGQPPSTSSPRSWRCARTATASSPPAFCRRPPRCLPRASRDTPNSRRLGGSATIRMGDAAGGRGARRGERASMSATGAASARPPRGTAIDPRFYTVFSAMAAGVIVSAPDGRCIFVNDAAARLIGAPSPEQAAAEWDALAARGVLFDRQGTPLLPGETPAARVAAGAPSAELVLRLRREGGVERWLTLRALPLCDA